MTDNADNPVVALLRRAAADLREMAQAATPGPWGVVLIDGAPPAVDGPAADGHMIAETYACGDPEHAGRANADAAHIAGWHPLVAAAVAGLLEAEAKRAEAGLFFNPDYPQEGWWCVYGSQWPAACKCFDAALAVARAWLGETGEGS